MATTSIETIAHIPSVYNSNERNNVRKTLTLFVDEINNDTENYPFTEEVILSEDEHKLYIYVYGLIPSEKITALYEQLSNLVPNTYITVHLSDENQSFGATNVYFNGSCLFSTTVDSKLKDIRHWLEYTKLREFECHCPNCNTPVEAYEIYNDELDATLEMMEDDNEPLYADRQATVDALDDTDNVAICPNTACRHLFKRNDDDNNFTDITD